MYDITYQMKNYQEVELFHKQFLRNFFKKLFQ